MAVFKAYEVSKAGNINHLQIVERELAPPQPKEVQVDVKSIGLNFADIFAILGLYGATPKGSFIPGLEYAGKVTATGKDVKGYKVGDRVMGVTRFGGYTSCLNIEADYITSIPEDWSYSEGAAFLVQALTAYYGLFRLGDLKQGDTVLIHSAAGGVGLQANRMAQKAGAYTIGTVGSKVKVPLLKKEGYQDFLVRDKHFRKKLVKKLQGRELNLIMECIGGRIMKAGYDLLAPQGRLINYGSARYGDTSNSPNWLRLGYLYLTRPKIDPQKMIETNKAILGFNLIWLYHKKELMREVVKELEAFNLPAPLVGHKFDFQDLPKAIKLFQAGKTTGKVVVNV
jgi:NADPH:quinone reductase-like Zn-dependent oxidoreductase